MTAGEDALDVGGSPRAAPGHTRLTATDDPLSTLDGRTADEHRALVTRTLGISEATYAAVCAAFAESLDPAATTEARIERLASIYARHDPHRAPIRPFEVSDCPLCHGHLRPIVSRLTDDPGRDLVYGLCPDCGYAALLAGAAPPSIYADGYHRSRRSDGAGYASYAEEAAYRVAKGARLLASLLRNDRVLRGPLLEVGSGYGFTRVAAAQMGWSTTGVDVSDEAATEAERLHGLETFTGTLAEAFEQGVVRERHHVLVLYQFVLEHLTAPVDELRMARRALAEGGAVVVVVPSSRAAELKAFGASYRSLRADHLHLFSPDSLALVARGAGLRVRSMRSECSLHLLADFLSREQLAGVYDSLAGPDLVAVLEEET